MALLSTLQVIAEPALEIPIGTRIELRLKTRIASNASKVNDPIEAVVISPVMLENQIVIASGTKVEGIVKRVQGIDSIHPSASIALEFSRMQNHNGGNSAITAQLIEVDNAREKVDESGQIMGILVSETLSSRMDDALQKLNSRFGALASVLQEAKNFVVKQTDAEIEYGAGVELSLTLSKPISGWISGDDPNSYVKPIQRDAELSELVTKQPFQTVAQKPPKPSDVTNLMFLGSRDDLQRAFEEAGWARAADLDRAAKIETMRAIVEDRGYSEAPVSILLLDSHPPDLVFEKMNNTFAKRHHLRVWKRPETFHGREVWVCAATHDIAIEFSPENKTFIHKIDSRIDRERAKVVLDILFTGLAKGISLVDRPSVPSESSNATGDKLITDGKMAVLLF